jgi:hypothetical protein
MSPTIYLVGLAAASIAFLGGGGHGQPAFGSGECLRHLFQIGRGWLAFWRRHVLVVWRSSFLLGISSEEYSLANGEGI